jgi:hypothetical protein
VPKEDTQFKPGQPSANPGGRPKGFANKIKALCGDDYDKLADGLFMIAFGTKGQREEFFGEDVKVTAKDRVAALKELRDSGPGRPVQTLDHRGNVPGTTRVIHEEADLSDTDLPAAATHVQ